MFPSEHDFFLASCSITEGASDAMSHFKDTESAAHAERPIFSLQEEKVRGNKRVGKASFNSFEGDINMKNRKHWLKMKLQTLD